MTLIRRMGNKIKYKRLVFKPEQEDITTIDATRLVTISEEFGPRNITDNDVYTPMAKRTGGIFKNKAIFLNTLEYDWMLGRDNENTLCLVPLKKIENEPI